MNAHRTPEQRVSRSRLDAIAQQLSPRDHDVLRFLSQHRYATTRHLQVRFFHQHATLPAATRATVRALDRLLRLRLLTRLERKVGGHTRGSAAYIWHLDAAGERLTRGEGAARRRYVDPALPFLEHSLQITETITLLHQTARTGVIQLTQIDAEPAAWRSFTSPAGGLRILKPDLFVSLINGDYDDHWYIEIDRGTESLPLLLAKCHAYAHYRRTGRAQGTYGVFPGVLWVLPTKRRVARLAAAITADPLLPDRLFTIITPDQLVDTIQNPPGSTPHDISELRKEEPTP